MDNNGITGELGVLRKDDTTYSYSGGSSTSTNRRMKVKVLKRKRFIVNKEINFPLPGAAAVINFDWVTTNQGWTDVVEDNMWDQVFETVRESLLVMALECLKSFDILGADQSRAMEFLKNFASYYVERLDYTKEPLKKTEFYKKIVDLPLFLSMEDKYVSLDQLRKIKKKSGSVAYVDPAFRIEAAPQRLVLRAGPSDLDLLGKLFGRDQVENYQEHLQNRQLSEIVRKTRGQEEPVVPPREVLFVRDINRDGVTGQAGLLRWKFAPSGNMSSLRFYKEKVPVIQRLARLDMQVRAAVNFDRFTVNRQWSNVREDDNYKQAMTVLDSFLEELVEELIKRFDGLEGEDANDGRLHLIAYVTGRYRRFSRCAEGS